MENIVADIIRDVAERRIIPRFQKLADHEVRSKTTPTDLVTIADEEAEADLAVALADLLPGSIVLGEEMVARGEAARELLLGPDPVWVIDPVDGTSNFAAGNPVFGTIVALCRAGVVERGWIYKIPDNQMYAAERGAGIRLNGAAFTPGDLVRMAVTDLPGANGFVSTKFMPKAVRDHAEPHFQSLKAAHLCRCCAYEYTALLEGAFHLSLYKRIEPWDHLAGAMMLDEAGMVTRLWDGGVYRPGILDGGLLNAVNDDLWTKARAAFVPKI